MKTARLYYDPFTGNILTWDEKGENWEIQPTDEKNVVKHWYLKEYMWAMKMIKTLADSQIVDIFEKTGEITHFNE